jgi:hypothetical protein
LQEIRISDTKVSVLQKLSSKFVGQLALIFEIRTQLGNDVMRQPKIRATFSLGAEVEPHLFCCGGRLCGGGGISLPVLRSAARKLLYPAGDLPILGERSGSVGWREQFQWIAYWKRLLPYRYLEQTRPYQSHSIEDIYQVIET